MLLTMTEVVAHTSLGRATINRLRRKGDFPRAVQLTPSRIAFKPEEIEAWLASRQQGGETS